MFKNIFLISFLFCFYSCNENKNVRKYTLPKNKQIDNANLSSKKNVNDLNFSWIAPNHWLEGKKNSMRIGSYKIPYNDSFADLSITYFKGDGGGLLENVNRWRGQLDLPTTTIEEINKNYLTGAVRIGDYKLLKIFNENNLNKAFLCIVISVKNSTLFLKLDTSFESIDFLEKEIIKFINTFNYRND